MGAWRKYETSELTAAWGGSVPWLLFWEADPYLLWQCTVESRPVEPLPAALQGSGFPDGTWDPWKEKGTAKITGFQDCFGLRHWFKMRKAHCESRFPCEAGDKPGGLSLDPGSILDALVLISLRNQTSGLSFIGSWLKCQLNLLSHCVSSLTVIALIWKRWVPQISTGVIRAELEDSEDPKSSQVPPCPMLL